MANVALALWQRLSPLPGGRRAFSRLVCLKAPYFGSIRPVFDELGAGRAVAHAPLRRAVKNHIGTFHAIALCNLAELVAGTLSEVTVPPTHRWIPKGMRVGYLKKTFGGARAIATLVLPDPCPDGHDAVVDVSIIDDRGDEVVHAEITMWVTARARR